MLLHGNCGDRRYFDSQFDALAKLHRVLRYDIRGYGKSMLPDKGVPYSDFEDLERITAPALIITAECDLDACRAVAHEMDGEIPDSTRFDLAGATHFTFIGPKKRSALQTIQCPLPGGERSCRSASFRMSRRLFGRCIES